MLNFPEIVLKYNLRILKLSTLSEDIASSYHHICLARGIVPERVVLRRTASHCQKEQNKEDLNPEEANKLNLEYINLNPNVAESSVLSLSQVSNNNRVHRRLFSLANGKR